MATISLKKTNWLFELDLSDEYQLLNGDKLDMSSYHLGVCRIRGKLFLLRDVIAKSGKMDKMNTDYLDRIISWTNDLSIKAQHSKIDLNQVNGILDMIYVWGDSLADKGLLSTTRRCWIKTIF